MYIGLLSEIYDIVYKNQSDVDAYIKIAKKYSGKVLELGSGSGRVSIELAKEGHDVTSLEIHRDMIHLHEEKLTDDIKHNTKLILGDMTSFDLDEQFDLIIASNNVINYLKDENEFINMLSSARRHLTVRGVFVIETDFPDIDSMKRLHGIERTSHYKNPRTKFDIEGRTTRFFNFRKQTEKDKIIATEFNEGRIKRRVEVLNHLKFWFPQEIREFIRLSGLSVMLESGSINEIIPLDEDSKSMVFYLKK